MFVLITHICICLKICTYDTLVLSDGKKYHVNHATLDCFSYLSNSTTSYITRLFTILFKKSYFFPVRLHYYALCVRDHPLAFIIIKALMCTWSKAQRLIWYSVIANAYAIMHNGREISTILGWRKLICTYFSEVKSYSFITFIFFKKKMKNFVKL